MERSGSSFGVGLGVLASAVAAALGSGPVLAQDVGSASQNSNNALEEVFVTGSRIVRRDFDANSPIMTVDAARFEESSTIAIESVVNQLPQFVPAASQFQSDGDGTGGYMSGATRTPGASMVSLRGLGPNRNLVLLDGRRAMPVNASMAVNVNNIPSAALERVETITGGASSVYGADAIAGVVNFVLKRNFEGFDFDVQYGETAEGDAEEYRVSAILGANFADGRGNVLLGVEHGQRGELRQIDRDFYAEGFADPTVLGTGRLSSSGIVISGTNPVDQAVVDQIFDQLPAGSVAPTGTFHMNSDGTVYKSTAMGSYRYNGPLVDDDGIVWRKYYQDGRLVQNRPQLTAQLPLERYSLFARGEYELTDRVRIFGQGLFTDTSSEAYGTFNAHVGGWGASVPHGDEIYAPSVDENGNTLPAFLAGGPYGLDCPPVGGCTKSQAFPKPPEIELLLNSRVNPNEDVTIYNVPVWLGQKYTENDISLYQLVGGFEGDFPNSDWTWEFYASHGVTRTQATMYGNTRLEGFRWVINQPNYGRGLSYIGNEDYGGFGAGNVFCETGYPIFYGVNGWVESAFPFLPATEGLPSKDCMDTISAIVKDNSKMEQNIAEFNMQGGAFDLPAGQLRFALGASYRKNKFDYIPDSMQSHSAIRDSIAGLYPVNASSGSVSATDIYGELLVPVISNKPGAREMNLELGYRRSNNDPSDDVDTYKALLDWSITDRVRFRGGRQKANRAPNVAELFQASEQVFYNSANSDWCSELNPNNPLSPNPNLNPNAAQARALCEAIMGPAAAAVYYSGDQYNGLTQGRWTNVIGNPNLHSEEADTLTAGIVANITDRATLTIDYWNIEINDMVSRQDVEAIHTECFSPDSNPTFDPAHPACQLIERDPVDGTQVPYFVTYTNEAAIDIAGVDLQFDWGREVGPGQMTVSFLASVLDHVKSRTSPKENWNDWKGSGGPTDVSGVQGMSYDYRTFTTIGYSQGPWTTSLRWRHLPSIKSETSVLFPETSTAVPTNSYNMFDFAGRYSSNGSWEIRFGIDNLFDKDPELTFPDHVTSAKGSTNANFYDILGRRFYVGMRLAL